jgi:hypothetical protein
VLAAVGAVCEPFGVCWAPLLTVKKHPFVLFSNPPERPPDRVLLLARTIQYGHWNTSPYPLILGLLLVLLQSIAYYCNQRYFV